MRDTHRMHHRSEVRLDRVQVIWLTLGMLVALGVVFALGVVIGRRGALLAIDAAGGAPIAELNAAGDIHDELTFYERLTADREKGVAPVKEQQPRPAPKPNIAVDTTPEADNEPAVEARATPPAADPDAAIRTAMQNGPALAGEYTIQIYSFQSMAEARASAASLERKGYKTFVVKSQINGKGTWFRVRLGRFETEADAKRAKMLLAASDLPAWVLRTE